MHPVFFFVSQRSRIVWEFVSKVQNPLGMDLRQMQTYLADPIFPNYASSNYTNNAYNIVIV